jgi:6-phosphogluconolactonase
VAVDPSGKFAYVANAGDNTVSGYTINSATGALTAIAGSPFASGGSGPLSVAVDPSGKFAYVVNGSVTDFAGVNVSGYTINSTTGALTAIAGSPFAAGSGPTSPKTSAFSGSA